MEKLKPRGPWSAARDVAIILFVLFTFGGLVYYHYYLQSFGIPQDTLDVATTSVFIFSLVLFTRYLGVGVVVLIFAIVTWWFLITLRIFHRKRYRHIRSILGTSTGRLTLFIVAIGVIFFVAKVDAKKDAEVLRTGRSRVLASITFGYGETSASEVPKNRDVTVKGTAKQSVLVRFPATFVAANDPAKAELIPILETTDAFYMLVQSKKHVESGGKTEYANGQVFEVSKGNVALVTRYIPNFQVAK